MSVDTAYRTTVNVRRIKSFNKGGYNTEMKLYIRKAVREISELYRTEIINVLDEMSSMPEYELSIRTQRNKGNSKVLLETGKLRASLVIQNNKLSIKKGSTHGIPYRTMWEIHEYGTDKIPPRPAWGIAWNRVAKQAQIIMSKYMQEYFLNKISNSLKG